MSKWYTYCCHKCGWEGERYSNIKLCPECKSPLERLTGKILCYHGTTKENAESIMRIGFSPDSWFAVHMEHALKFGGNTILSVEFERLKCPNNWQFHVLDAIPLERIINIYTISEVSK